MSTRSTTSNLFSPLRDPESLIRRRNFGEPSSLFDYEEVMSIPHNNMGPPLVGPPPPNNGPPPVVRPNGPAPRSMEELCQPSINGRGEPIAPIPIEATNFGLRHHMIQQQNGVSDDALRLSLFPYSLTHHAIAWYDRLPRNFIHSFDDMMRKFLSKYFPPSMDTSATRDETSRNISSTTSTESLEVVRQLELMNKNFLNMMKQMQTVKSVDTKCETYGGPHSFTKCPAINGYTQEAAYTLRNNEIKNMLSNFFQMQNPSGSGSLPSNTVANPRGDVKAITTRSGVAYDGPSILPTPSPLPKEVEHETEATKDKVQSRGLMHLCRGPLMSCVTGGWRCAFYVCGLGFWGRGVEEQLGAVVGCGSGRWVALCGVRLGCGWLRWPNFGGLSMWCLSGLIGDWEKVIGGKRGGAGLKGGRRCGWNVGSLGGFDYDVDPRVPLILGRPVLRTARALIDVYGEELTLRVNDEAITFKYAQEVLGFSNSSTSGNPTPSDPIIASSSPSLTPFEGGDFILEEIETYLCTPEELSNLDNDYYDTEGDILYLEKLLNEDPSPTLPPMKNDDLKQVDVTMTKPSIEEPPELELKDLPSHLEYAFLEGTDKLPVIISKELKEEEKAALLKEVIKLIDAGLIYPISDSPWLSPVHCVPKKGGMTVVENEDNELIPTRLVTGWRICIDYRKLDDATRKDHFPLPFMDQMQERLAGNEYYCFLDGFSRYFQIPIDPQDQEKTTFTCPYGTFAYRRMPFGLCNAPGTFQRCMMAIFHDMIEETMKCEDTNLVLNWEKCHFMVKEGIVLGHKISKSEIEVDRAKVDVIAKLPHPTSIKGV
ncbi:reverse transcriptase domain-containing protein [Tanacetum coccineum]